LDRGEPGGEASSAAAGMLAPAPEMSEPGPFLDLAMRSLDLWPEFAAGVEEASGMSCGLRSSALLHVAWDQDEAAVLQERLEWQRAAGAEVEWLDGAATLEAEPALAGSPAGAACFTRAGSVDGRAAVAALVAALRTRDVEIRTGAAVERGWPGGAPRVRGGEAVRGRAVVFAAGAWTGQLVRPWEGVSVPIRPLRGQLVALEGVEPRPQSIVYGGPHGYAVPRDDGTVLVGATEEDAGFDAAPTTEATARLVEAAGRLLRGSGAATKVTPRAGLRPGTPDGLPVLGEGEPTAFGSRLLVAAGHHRNGVLLAPATAAGIADMVLDRRRPAGWQAFAPGRGRAAATPSGHAGHRHGEHAASQ
ncbi:MAG TPA: FAD-dependent oxidoreductase, partial [Candidatus Dormibacteraeota bacterium]|nr:FAD-dependent oxidoreductase [Candidatus Dormibacteraeota bacterium]